MPNPKRENFSHGKNLPGRCHREKFSYVSKCLKCANISHYDFGTNPAESIFGANLFNLFSNVLGKLVLSKILINFISFSLRFLPTHDNIKI